MSTYNKENLTDSDLEGNFKPRQRDGIDCRISNTYSDEYRAWLHSDRKLPAPHPWKRQRPYKPDGDKYP